MSALPWWAWLAIVLMVGSICHAASTILRAKYSRPPIDCAACGGTGKSDVRLGFEGGFTIRGDNSPTFMLMQGVCLGCRGSGKRAAP